MNTEFDVIIVGSGPAGVSAAFPLVEAGLKVLLVDGGRSAPSPNPVESYLESRSKNNDQWEWMIGRDFHALRNFDSLSPKLRVPMYAQVFAGFDSDNKVQSTNFVAIGSMAQGGLSNAWGCGVARLSNTELSNFPFHASTISDSYGTVARRMGISGAVNDDLSKYFDVDEFADSPVDLDLLQSRILDNYQKNRNLINSLGLRIGRSRVAALTRDRGDRKACNLSGNCLWGCHRRSLYSATEDLKILRGFDNFSYISGFIVEGVESKENLTIVRGNASGFIQSFNAKKLLLAAGTLATTRLALKAIGCFNKPTRILSSPTAAFMLCFPRALGSKRLSAFGLGQLSFSLDINDDTLGFGSLFNTLGIPVSEFSRYLPFAKRYGIDLLQGLLSSCVVGNIFLPGRFSTTVAYLRADDTMQISGGYDPTLPELMNFSKERLTRIFSRLGAYMLPRSFSIGRPGSDIHYSGSFPMRKDPCIGETNSYGELFGANNIYLVDGSSLTELSEKSHTLTIMANADRIGKRIASELIYIN